MMPPPPGRHDPLEPFRDRCRSCQAHILWADTADNRMPVDAQPTSCGNVVLTTVAATGSHTPARLVAGVLSHNQAAGARDRGVRLYLSHFASCPDAARFRRTRVRSRRS